MFWGFPTTTYRFSCSQQLTELSIQSNFIAKIYYSKRIQGKNQQREKTHDTAQRRVHAASKRLFPVESHRMHLHTLALNCDKWEVSTRGAHHRHSVQGRNWSWPCRHRVLGTYKTADSQGNAGHSTACTNSFTQQATAVPEGSFCPCRKLYHPSSQVPAKVHPDQCETSMFYALLC